MSYLEETECIFWQAVVCFSHLPADLAFVLVEYGWYPILQVGSSSGLISRRSDVARCRDIGAYAGGELAVGAATTVESQSKSCIQFV